MKLAGAEAEFDPAVLLEAAAVDDVGNEKGPAVFPPVAAEATDAGAEVPKTNPPDEIAPPAPDAAAAFTASGWPKMARQQEPYLMWAPMQALRRLLAVATRKIHTSIFPSHFEPCKTGT